MTNNPEDNKDVIRHFEEEWNKGSLEGIIALFDENYVDHNLMPGQPQGIEGLRLSLQKFFTAFPDMQLHTDMLIAEGDKVTDHGYGRGTHSGDFFGIPATGKPVTMEYLDIHRIVDGKIAEAWHLENMFGVMAQIGAFKIPGPKK